MHQVFSISSTVKAPTLTEFRPRCGNEAVGETVGETSFSRLANEVYSDYQVMLLVVGGIVHARMRIETNKEEDASK
jgi:hypothetical protein